MRSVAVTVVALTVVGGCSGRPLPVHVERDASVSTDAAAGGDDAGASRACDELGLSACVRRSACASPSERGQRFADEETCRARWTLACLAWSGAAGAGLDVTGIVACATEIAGADCRQVSTLFVPAASEIPFCLRALGQRVDGAPCAISTQCRSLYCSQWTSIGAQRDLVGGCGVCAAPEPGGSPSREGDACGAGTCAAGLSCSTGVCLRGICGEPGFCDSGSACSLSPAPTKICSRGTECLAQNDRGDGTCIPYAADGEPCDDRGVAGPVCQFPARCLANHCVLPSELACPPPR